ncbi:MAG: hypothetical protein QOJ07_1206 [Thermoleophilaceae bacterium]|jgi:hypothetical protein|nr:hypothetical protein [Thermoleophilaceae bacterium]
MSKGLMLLVALLALAGFLASTQEPEIRRYLKIRSM